MDLTVETFLLGKAKERSLELKIIPRNSIRFEGTLTDFSVFSKKPNPVKQSTTLLRSSKSDNLSLFRISISSR
jgi:hypothetical protein